MRSAKLLSLAAILIEPALADIHYFYLGYFSESYISLVEFDDSLNTLKLSNNVSITGGSSRWLAADAQFKNLYTAGTSVYQSFTVGDDLSLTFASEVAGSSDCSLGVSLAVQTAPPYYVFGVPFVQGCPGIGMSVDAGGALAEAFANLTYDSAAGVHGLAMSPDSGFVYSADDDGSSVWVHAVNGTAGTATELQRLDGAGARHLVAHPNGAWVYVVYESANEIGVYARDAATGELAAAGATYSLLPDGLAANLSSSYWSSDVAVSNSTSAAPAYLYGLTRSRTTGVAGYVSAFALDGETGAVAGKLFTVAATEGGGTTNSVTPSKFSEEVFAITDEGSSFVEVWQMADNGSSASVLAHLDTAISGPVNVVWYS